jgi:hypothetical protein
MVRVRGLTSSRKRHRKAPPAKVAPEKDEELVADDDGPWPSLKEIYVGPSPRDPYRQALTMRPSLKVRPLVS